MCKIRGIKPNSSGVIYSSLNVINYFVHQPLCELDPCWCLSWRCGDLSKSGGGSTSGPVVILVPGKAGPWFHLNSDLNGGTFGPLEMLENMNWHTATTPASSHNILCFLSSADLLKTIFCERLPLWRMMEQINLSLANKNKLNYFSGWSF